MLPRIFRVPPLVPLEGWRRGIVLAAATVLVLAWFLLPWTAEEDGAASAFQLAARSAPGLWLSAVPLAAVAVGVLAWARRGGTRAPFLAGFALLIAAVGAAVIGGRPHQAGDAAALFRAVTEGGAPGPRLLVGAAFAFVAVSVRGVRDGIVKLGTIAAALVLSVLTLAGSGNDSIRVRTSEIILAGSACRTTITEIYASGTAARMEANGWGCEQDRPASPSVRSVTTDRNGRITLTVANLAPHLDGKVVTLYPADQAGNALTYAPGPHPIPRWVCGGEGTTLPVKYLPGSCRGR